MLPFALYPAPPSFCLYSASIFPVFTLSLDRLLLLHAALYMSVFCLLYAPLLPPSRIFFDACFCLLCAAILPPSCILCAACFNFMLPRHCTLPLHTVSARYLCMLLSIVLRLHASFSIYMQAFRQYILVCGT